MVYYIGSMATDDGLANPAPLGLVGFGLTTVLLSLVNAGIFGMELERAVLPLALTFGGTIQLIAGILEFKKGNTFGTTAFTSYGAFWWWFGLLVLFQTNGIIGNVSPAAIGAVLIMWGIFTNGMWVGTFRLNWALWTVFLLTTSTFYLLGFGDLLGIDLLVTLGGWVGIVTGLSAMYVCLAEVVNWCFDRDIVPLGGTPLSGF